MPIFDNVSQAWGGIKILTVSQVVTNINLSGETFGHRDHEVHKLNFESNRRLVRICECEEGKKSVERSRIKPNQLRFQIMSLAKLQMICVRTIPFVDVDSLACREGREALFRDDGTGFLLYLSMYISSSQADERVVPLDAREALLWLSEDPQDQGSFWAWDRPLQ